MRPGGGARSNYAHSTNMTKLARNAHITYNFEDEDEDSLFIPELPASLQAQLRVLKRNKERSDSALDHAAEDDFAAMHAIVPDEEDPAAMYGEETDMETDMTPDHPPEDGHHSTVTLEDTAVPEARATIRSTVSDGVATRLAAIRASRTPQPRQEGTNSISATTVGSMSSSRSAAGSAIASEGSPSMSAVELRRAELARIRAARAAVNQENESMLQAMEAAKAKRAQAEARELEELEREIAAENEKLELARRHAEEIRAHGLDLEGEEGGMIEVDIKLEIEG